MKLISAFIAFYTTLFPKKFNDDKHIEPAFTFDGITYYHYPNETNMKPERYVTMVNYVKESTMNCDKEFLEWHIQACEKIIYETDDKAGVKLKEVQKLIAQLGERVNTAFIPDLIYKIASAMYFDKNESPESYDFDYNDEKIKRWKTSNNNFFLDTPIKDLITSEGISAQRLGTYMMIADKIDKKSMESIYEWLSEGKSKKDLQNLSRLRVRAGMI